MLAMVSSPAFASPSLAVEPSSGEAGTPFSATFTLGGGNCSDDDDGEAKLADFSWDGAALGTQQLSGKQCKGTLSTSVPSDATAGNHTVSATVQGDGSSAQATFNVTASSTTSSTTTTTTTTSPPASPTSQPAPGDPSPTTSAPPPGTDPAAPAITTTTDSERPSTSTSSTSSSTSTTAATSTSRQRAKAASDETEQFGCPRVLATGDEDAAGFPVVPTALIGGTAGGGALLGGWLLRRRLSVASTALVIGVAATLATTIAQPSAVAAQEETAPSSADAIGTATFSGVAGAVDVIDVRPHADADRDADATDPPPTSPWTITKPLDHASPPIIEAVVTGDAFRCVEIRLDQDDEGTSAMFALADVRVTSVRHHSDADQADAAVPTEQVELHFTRVAYRYTSTDKGDPIEGVVP
jgi:type VI secretion system Hcp family effector